MKTVFVLTCVLCGCHSPAKSQTSHTSGALEGEDDGYGEHSVESADPMSSSSASAATASEKLLAEATRELGAMKSSRYRHKTNVDEASGIFEYDCSGFVVYALRTVLPNALAVIPISTTGVTKGRPKAESFATYFAGLGSDGPWSRVSRGADVKPGDVIAWLKPEGIESTNTGHMVIVRETPKKIAASDPVTAIGGAGEWLIRVIDSTESGHADDPRNEDQNGLGSGTIGIVVDGADTPIGYRWKGGRSPKAWATMVSIARPR